MLHQGAAAADITHRILDGLGATDSGFSLVPRWGTSFLFMGRCTCCAGCVEQCVHAIGAVKWGPAYMCFQARSSMGHGTA